MKKRVLVTISLLGGVLVGGIISNILTMRQYTYEVKKWKELSDKHLKLMILLKQWLATKQQGKSIVDYFHKENISTIAIYGISYVGERLYEELKDSDITVKYAIDKNADGIYSELELVSPNEELEAVDAIIVTPIVFFAEIEKELSAKVDCPIISLKEIIYQL